LRLANKKHLPSSRYRRLNQNRYMSLHNLTVLSGVMEFRPSKLLNLRCNPKKKQLDQKVKMTQTKTRRMTPNGTKLIQPRTHATN